jgi:hypothetical protein
MARSPCVIPSSGGINRLMMMINPLNFERSSVRHFFLLLARRDPWPHGQCARVATSEDKQHSQRSINGRVTKIYYFEFRGSEGTLPLSNA